MNKWKEINENIFVQKYNVNEIRWKDAEFFPLNNRKIILTIKDVTAMFASNTNGWTQVYLPKNFFSFLFPFSSSHYYNKDFFLSPFHSPPLSLFSKVKGFIFFMWPLKIKMFGNHSLYEKVVNSPQNILFSFSLCDFFHQISLFINTYLILLKYIRGGGL